MVQPEVAGGWGYPPYGGVPNPAGWGVIPYGVLP
jgi:hypothetical protein